MIKLKSIILKLTEDEYNGLSEQFRSNKADKYLTLLEHYRDNKLEDEKIQEVLDVSTNAYYTLKSRLLDKIREFLSGNLSGPVMANIPNLVYNTHKDMAIAILTKLESEMQNYDMPHELTSVYNA